MDGKCQFPVEVFEDLIEEIPEPKISFVFDEFLVRCHTDVADTMSNFMLCSFIILRGSFIRCIGQI